MSRYEYRVEDRGSFICGDGVTELPDFRVVLYIDGDWENEWDGGWTEPQATKKANLLMSL